MIGHKTPNKIIRQLTVHERQAPDLDSAIEVWGEHLISDFKIA